MVTRLLTFVEASPAWNWLLDHKVAEEMMLDFSSMNRVKYCIMRPVYIVDMYNLHHRAPDVWAVFTRGIFSCQKMQYIRNNYWT